MEKFYNDEELLLNLDIPKGNVWASDFLHGECQYFALELAKIYGYKLVLWINYDEEFDKTFLVHAFATTEVDGKRKYIDVRGITESMENIEEGFDYLEEPCGTKMKIKLAEQFLKNLNIDFRDPNLIKVSKSIINKNKDMYTLAKNSKIRK